MSRLKNERDLLNEHKGCTRCRRFYVDPDHERDCCKDWPDANNYKPLTRNDAFDAKARHEKRSNHRNTVAATLPMNSEFDDVYNASVAALLGNDPTYGGSKGERSVSAPPTSHIREINAILPSSSIPFVLEGSDTSEENTFLHGVSSAPLSVEHLIWEANIFGGNEFPTRKECLLDNSAHLVLIRPEMVADLALPIKKLKEPIRVTLAIQGTKTVIELYDYVNLQLSSLNNEWTSKPVRALIAKDLCTNILLGLPFLTHNKIVIDHETRSAIAKDSGFNLMDNQSVMPRDSIRKMIPPKIRVKQILENRKTMITELKMKCAERLAKMNTTQTGMEPKAINAIMAIKATIERLAAKDNLNKLEETLKDKYEEIFKPIPHISKLPEVNMARIHVKDAYKKIATRGYTCPRQYRDAFKTLIDQRLESGFIRPSSSQYASPSFIVPKADPTAVPRWVCDFRQLNPNTIPDNWAMPRIDDILADCAKGKIIGLQLI